MLYHVLDAYSLKKKNINLVIKKLLILNEIKKYPNISFSMQEKQMEPLMLKSCDFKNKNFLIIQLLYVEIPQNFKINTTKGTKHFLINGWTSAFL